jgi:hypothetical protein
MRRLKGAPDLRNTEATAEAITSQVNILFAPEDRTAVKAFMIYSFCLEFKSMGDVLQSIGVCRHQNHSNIALEVTNKRKNSICYSMKFDALMKDWKKHAPKSVVKAYKTNSLKAINRL